MPSHIYSEIYLHVTWHTEGDLACINGTVESFIHNHLSNRCRETKGVYFHGVGGTDNHIHLAIQIEPHITISDLIGELKGSCSHDTNANLGRKLISWQRGYGVVSFGRRNLPWVQAYIRNQREHHAGNTTHNRLEAVDESLESPAEAGCQEDAADYSPT